MHIAIILTAFLVSLDAIFVGMSLRLQKGFRRYYFLIISAIIITFCLPSYFAAKALKAHIDFQTYLITGTVFILLGIKVLFSRDEEKLPSITPKTVLLVGLVMSLDAVMATVSLTLDQSTVIFIPFLVTGVHMLFLFIGGGMAKIIKTPHSVHNIVSALCLFLIGVLKLAGVF